MPVCYHPVSFAHPCYTEVVLERFGLPSSVSAADLDDADGNLLIRIREPVARTQPAAWDEASFRAEVR